MHVITLGKVTKKKTGLEHSTKSKRRIYDLICGSPHAWGYAVDAQPAIFVQGHSDNVDSPRLHRCHSFGIRFSFQNTVALNARVLGPRMRGTMQVHRLAGGVIDKQISFHVDTGGLSNQSEQGSRGHKERRPSGHGCNRRVKRIQSQIPRQTVSGDCNVA